MASENWTEADENRMDVIGSNGNDGAVYREFRKKATKYHREIKSGVFVDVYDVLVAFNVANPALQHLIKKALAAGQRGHKDLLTDMQDIIDSAHRAMEIEKQRL